MVDKKYWLNLFTGTTWQEFLDAGGKVTGFKEKRWVTTQKIKKGDYLLCYVIGISRLIGLLEVTSEAFKDYENRIWSYDPFPSRINVKPIILLTPETAVPITTLKDRLPMFTKLKNPNMWGNLFRGSPKTFKLQDAEIMVKSIYNAHKNPIERSYNKKKFETLPKFLKTKNINTPITVPNEPTEEYENIEKNDSKAQISVHTQIQWLLLKLGDDMGFNIWVARNDRNRDFDGNKFTDLTGAVTELPVQFDEATNNTIKLIDVLWLKENNIIAAFEIESTTSIYSGLLRMSDLVTMNPNLSIPLYLVAPDERRGKVIQEVNRPTFSKLPIPLKEICRYIPFSELKNRIEKYKEIIKFIKPEILDEISESCEIEEI